MKITVMENDPADPTRAVGQMSWRRLAREVLPASGELLPGEEVVEFEVDGEWVRYVTRRKKS